MGQKMNGGDEVSVIIVLFFLVLTLRALRLCVRLSLPLDSVPVRKSNLTTPRLADMLLHVLKDLSVVFVPVTAIARTVPVVRHGGIVIIGRNT
ncbi:MAG: hypothetical protein SH850_18520 [Planctomycetaceae bacterium]|nr:hypothetical protein [Planctomycetaceae bacterium]